MKRYIYYFMIIGLLPVFSCTDGLDLYPNDKVTVDNYWNTAEDALRAVNATYSNIIPSERYVWLRFTFLGWRQAIIPILNTAISLVIFNKLH